MFSTLKIPEYMACARPVVSVPSGSITRLIEDGRNGFLLANEAGAWGAFLAALPDRARLAAMGEAAARSAQAISWDQTAHGYLSVCERLVTSRGVPVTARPRATSASQTSNLHVR
jgi:glycosyltransferase involved in cell wall biosynthesis